MTIRTALARWLLAGEQRAARKAMAISRIAAAQANGSRDQHARPPLLTPYGPQPPARENIFEAAPLPGFLVDAGVPDAAALAMDQGFESDGWGDVASAFNWREGIGFFGYPYLAELSQRVEYRKAVETYALDMTREWIRFTYQGDEDKSDKLHALDAEFTRLDVQGAFRRATEYDGYYGRGHVYVDLGASNRPTELRTPLVLDAAKIKKGSLKRLQVVDPTWTYPGVYDSTDPLHQHFYRPSHWYVMAKSVHESRIFTFVSRPVPDMLKPAYVFGGLSMTQMMKPYVDNWLRNRQSVSDLLHSFTVFWLRTDMGAILAGGDAAQLDLRADIFNIMRDNRGLMLLNKGDGVAGGDPGEEMGNLTVPMSGLNELLGGAMEQMAFAAKQPLVKYLGVTPAGLNASSDGEIRCYYDDVAGSQERMYRKPLEALLKLAQLSLFGEVDDDIGFEFLPLWQLDELEQAQARKLDAEIIDGHVNAGVVDAEEAREVLADDKHGPWANLRPSDVPEDPDADLAAAQLQGFGEKDNDAAPNRKVQAANDEKPAGVYPMHGMTIVVETPKGGVRTGVGVGGVKWKCTVAADYGYVMDTWSAEGRQEGMDCFVGPDRASGTVFVIDQLDLRTGQFDEHKCMLGYRDEVAAVADYCASYSDARGMDRVLDVRTMEMEEFRQWLTTADLYRPASRVVGP